MCPRWLSNRPPAGWRHRRVRLPARTIRLRLTLTYGLVFLLTGAVLLTIGYFLVRHNIEARPNFRAELRRLGLPVPPQRFRAPRPGPPRGFAFGNEVARAARAQLAAQTLHRLLLEYVAALVAMTVVSVVAGWLLAGRALAPLRAITATARRVSGENLGERIALTGPPDELKELADTFDGMLARLDRAFAGQRDFVANASHELRTPLAIMRTELDVALADPGASTEELRAMGEAVRETIDRSEALIAALLLLARSQGSRGGGEQLVDLTELVAACLTDLRRPAAVAGVEPRDSLTAVAVRGEPQLLERMIANLLDNGIRHNVPQGWLRVETWQEGARVHLLVANGGWVIAPEQAATLTEPFQRLDRTIGGFGLGLSIVRSVAEAHGGSVHVRAPANGGLEVVVSLPAAVSKPSVAVVRRHRSLTQS